jgi:3-hydroxyacyl-CoA dehydrogenase, NAD binding domain
MSGGIGKHAAAERPCPHVDRPHQRPGARSREISEWICRRGLAQSRPTVAVAGRAALGGVELSRRAGGGARRGRVRPRKRSRARGFEARLARPARCRPRPGDRHRVEFVGAIDERVQIDCRHPERCVIGHPFNLPHLVPLLEGVGSEKADPAAVERALAFYTAIGKQPIPIRREVPGMSPTGCSRRCGGRRCIWWPNGWRASPTSIRRSAPGRGYAGP